MSKNREVWEELGERDPYYAVVTLDEFHASNLDAKSKEAFFELGRSQLDEVWSEFEAISGGGFTPGTAIDYGCGVGRVLMPLAERCERVIGVDISRGMLKEAEKNADERGFSNVECQSVDQFTAADTERYDVVHTFIVLQHIPPAVGYGIIERLVKRLKSGGVGMIHVTYESSAPFFTRLRFRLYRDVPGLHKFTNLIRGRDFPFMPVYEYDLDKVRSILRESSCEISQEKDTDHGFRGKMFFFMKSGDQNGST